MTKDELKKIMIYATDANIELYTPLLNEYMHEFDICGKLREAAFLATIIHESGSFKYTAEIASGKAYEGRRDLGNINQGDGIKYKGRGLIQITGRRNYAQISDAFDIDFINNPKLLEHPRWATRSACWWWDSRELNKLADVHDFRGVTLIVNGGLNGWEDRQIWYNRALKYLK